MKSLKRIITWALIMGLLFSDSSITALAEVVLKLPINLTIIEEEAFYGDKSIDKVTLEENITEIRARAFADSSLSEINLPDSISYIDETAFYGLNNVKMISNKGSYGYDWALSHHYSLTGICGDNVTWLLDGQGVLTISGQGYMNDYQECPFPCEYVKKAIVESGITRIGAYAFQGCNQMEDIVIPDSVKSINSYAFSGCSGLSNVDIPVSVTHLGASVFRECSSLESVDIPEGVKTLNSYSFYKCINLKNVTIPDSVTTISYNVFQNCDSLRKIVIPNSVTSIGASAFVQCVGLTGIVLQEGLQSIGNSAFQMCTELNSITIPASVKSIGKSAFYGCSNLKDLYLYDVSAWMSIECGNNDSNPNRYASSIYVNGEILNSLDVPAGTTSIRNYAFRNCQSLTQINLPKSVVEIGELAFGNCTNLKDVYYAGTEQEAKEITINANNKYLNSATWHYYYTVSDISLDQNEVVLAVGDSETLSASVIPANATNKTINWISADTSVATVSEDGIVNGVAKGATTITAITEDGGYTATCEVKVYNSLDISIKTTSGSAATSWVKYVPTAATNTYIITSEAPWTAESDSPWITTSISDDKLSVKLAKNETGEERIGTVTVSNGVNTAVLTVIHSCITSKPTITFEPVLSSDINNPTVIPAMDLNFGATGYAPEAKHLYMRVYKLQESGQYTRANSNTGYWSIDKTGSVTLKPNLSYCTYSDPGTYKLIFGEKTELEYTYSKWTDVPSARQVCFYFRVAVEGTIFPVSVIGLDKPEMILNAGQSIVLDVTVLPSYATNKTINWVSSNTKVATVDNIGAIKAVTPGETFITAEASDGSGCKAICRVTVVIPVSKIKLEDTVATLNVGNSRTLLASIEPRNATNTTIEWKSSDDKIVTVDEDGVITAVKPGKAVVSASATDGSGCKGEIQINVPNGDILVERIILPFSEITMREGDSVPFEPAVVPSNAKNKELDWAWGNSSVARVENGTLYAYKAGTTVVYVEAEDGSATDARCNVNVLEAIPVSSVSLNKSYMSMKVGSTQYLSATVRPNNASNKAISWFSSNTDVATVDDVGNITGISVGKAIITATVKNSNISTSCEIEVYSSAEISIEDKNPYFWLLYTPDASKKSLIVSSELTCLVSTDCNWMLASILDNIITISVTQNDSGVERQGHVIVVNEVSEMIINVIQPAIVNKPTVHFSPELSKDPNNPTRTSAHKLEYTVSGLSGSAAYLYRTVYRKNDKNEFVEVDPSTMIWGKTNQTASFMMDPYDIDNDFTEEGTYMVQFYEKTELEYSCDKGDHKLPNSRCSCFFFTIDNSIPVLASSIKCKSNIQIYVGQTIAISDLSVAIIPSYTTERRYHWENLSSDVLFTKNDNGTVKITAQKEGIGRIKVSTKDGTNLSDYCTITVLPILTTLITWPENNITMNVGDEIDIFPVIEPENATYKSIRWELSNNNIVEVSNGIPLKIHALKAGNVSLWATTIDGTNLECVCDITVKDEFVFQQYGDKWEVIRYNGNDNIVRVPSKDKEGHNITRLGSEFHVGGTYTGAFEGNKTIQKVIIPSSITVIQKAVFSSCSNLALIEFSEGLEEINEYAFSDCTSLASISMPDTVTSIGESAFYGCTNLENVSLSSSLKELGSRAFGNCIKLNSIILPEGMTQVNMAAFNGCSSLVKVLIPASVTRIYTNSTVYKPANPNLVIYGETGSEAERFANDNGITFVTTTIFKVSSIDLNWKNVTKAVGKTLQLSASVLPENATNKRICWTSSDLDVASVDSNGLVTMLSPGNVVITASAADGSNVKSHCNIVISEDDIAVKSISISPEKSNAMVGDTLILTSEIVPGNATDQSLRWSSSDPSIAEVDQNGIVSMLSPGVVIISAETANGLVEECRLTVQSGYNQFIFTYDFIDSATCELYKFDGEYNEQATTVVIPEKDRYGHIVNTIYARAFRKVSWIKKVVFPDSVERISEDAFLENRNLTEIVLPPDLVYIGTTAFYGCEDLKYINLPTKLNTIEDYAFAHCKNLHQVTIPASVKKIGSGAFLDTANDFTIFGETGTVAEQYARDNSIPFVAIQGVTNLALDISSTKLEVGKTLQISAIITPVGADNKNIIWKSSDPSVATVKDGFVTALQRGKTIITAISSMNATFSASCSIEVMNSTLVSFLDGSAKEYNLPTLNDCSDSTELSLAVYGTWHAYSEQSWISVYPVSGNGNSQILISVEANLGNERHGMITITSGDQSIILNVEQCARLSAYPVLITPEYMNNSSEPKYISGDLSSIEVKWKKEKQVQYYTICLEKLNMWFSDDQEHYELIAKSEYIDTEDTYVFSNIEIEKGCLYRIKLCRILAPWVGKRDDINNVVYSYFVPMDTPAYVYIEGAKGNYTEYTLKMEAEGDEGGFEHVFSSGAWTATTNDDWLIVNDYYSDIQIESVLEAGNHERYSIWHGLNEDGLCVFVAPNMTGQKRVGKVIVSCAEAKLTLTIEQQKMYNAAELISPDLGRNRKSAHIAKDDINLKWNASSGGTGKYRIILYEYNSSSGWDCILLERGITATRYTISSDLLREGYDYELKLSSQIENGSYGTNTYYFHVAYEDLLTLNATVSSNTNVTNKNLTVAANAFGGAGSYKYAFELLRSGTKVSATTWQSSSRHTFDINADGRYQVRVYVKDSSGGEKSILTESQSITVTEVDEEPDTPLPSIETYTISGYTVSLAGVGIEGIYVHLYDSPEKENIIGTAITDSNGKWRISNIEKNNNAYLVLFSPDYEIIGNGYSINIDTSKTIPTFKAKLIASIDSDSSDAPSFTMTQNGKEITQTKAGEKVTFTVSATDAHTVRLVVDGKYYESYPVSNGTAVITRPFDSSGQRRVQFVAYYLLGDNSITEAQSLNVTSFGILDAPTIQPIGIQIVNQDVNKISWNAIANADNYRVYLYHNDMQLWPSDSAPWESSTSDTSIVIPGVWLIEEGKYIVRVVASGSNYDSSMAYAEFDVRPTQQSVEITYPPMGGEYNIGETMHTNVECFKEGMYTKLHVVDPDGGTTDYEPGPDGIFYPIAEKPGAYKLIAFASSKSNFTYAGREATSATVFVTVRKPDIMALKDQWDNDYAVAFTEKTTWLKAFTNCSGRMKLYVDGAFFGEFNSREEMGKEYHITVGNLPDGKHTVALILRYGDYYSTPVSINLYSITEETIPYKRYISQSMLLETYPGSGEGASLMFDQEVTVEGNYDTTYAYIRAGNSRGFVSMESLNLQSYAQVEEALALEITQPSSNSDYIAEKHSIPFTISLNHEAFMDNYYLETGIKEQEGCNLYTKTMLGECNKGQGIPTTYFTPGKYTLYARIREVKNLTGVPMYEQMSSNDPVIAEKTKEIMIYKDLATYNAYNNEMTELDKAFMISSYKEQYILQHNSMLLAENVYDFSKVSRTLAIMGFDILQKENEVSLMNSHTVGYVVGRKLLIIDGEETYIYVVAVRGTTGKAEWLSDFNIGESGNALGLEMAAKDVERYLDTLDIDVKRDRIWFCGHSRGAAVANYLAGYWTHKKDFDQNNVYAYCFACPLVVKDNSLYCPGIFNYNHRGDFVPMVPLEKWGFKRYGLLEHTKDYDGYLQYFKGIPSNQTIGLKEVLGLIDRQYYCKKIYPIVRQVYLQNISNGFDSFHGMMWIIEHTLYYMITEPTYKQLLNDLNNWFCLNNGVFLTDVIDPQPTDEIIGRVKQSIPWANSNDIIVIATDETKKQADKALQGLVKGLTETHMQYNYTKSVEEKLFYSN